MIPNLVLFMRIWRKLSARKFFYKFVVGDFDAKIGMTEEGKHRIGRFGSGLRNENGNRLVGLLSAARLFMVFPFMKKEYRWWTWESSNRTTHAEIDYLLTIGSIVQR
ncbi:unnamed protein product [Strongylus vulgaris]|uniref:Uncharacterized protein n=1 Tax=Strongylus vulgaris TaxID=40348 RepID=A0A3P7LJ09_STRVU|nr:unnamed protein product [Strongylus vulgaris]